MALHRRGKLLVAAATLIILAGLNPSSVLAQKFINFSTTGTVRSTLVFGNQIVPDVYMFFAEAGEFIRVETSNAVFDATLRVVGPDTSVGLFDDNSADGRNARIRFTAPVTGAYIVIVSSAGGNPGGGLYNLTLARGSSALQDTKPEPGLGQSLPEVESTTKMKPQK